MPSVADNLQTALDNIAAQLADMTVNPKPTYGIGPQSVSWGEHFRNLTDQMKVLREQIQIEGGPMWETTRGVS